MKICEYGCGQEAKYQFKNGKWCCSEHWLGCKNQRKRYTGRNNPFYNCNHTEETKKKLRKPKSEEYKKKMSSIKKGFRHTKESKKKISKAFKGENHPLFGRSRSSKVRKKISISNKITIKIIKKRYPFFSQIEEMRYNPDKLGEKEIQVRCKNHLCPNSKEQGGWFTPTRIQLAERIRQLEKDYGTGGCYFYCSEECKQICPLYNLQSDPLKETEKSYTQQEYQQFKEYVLKRDDYKCQYCEGTATEIHHERPQKLEPFFALDPDFAWSCCEKCHYKYGHKTGTECSTGNLANKTC